YVEDPISTVRQSNGLTEFQQTAPISNKEMDEIGKKLGKQRYAEISKAVPKSTNQWSAYPQNDLESPRKAS
ncbi:MAG TPA: hypothetical protein VJQ54_14375, partial [Candidatus Sulfotelmatobacter sp.]|nr:hypothetical protein [Candidatus Sulfotelmatobacter sp.]